MAIAAIYAWCCAGRAGVPTAMATAAARGGASSAARVVSKLRETVPNNARASEAAVRRDATPAAPAGLPCTVRLIGLRANVPWTVPLKWLYLAGREVIKEHRGVDAQGMSYYSPPADVQSLRLLQIKGADPAYRLDYSEARVAALARGETLDLVAEPIGVLHGLVRSPDGGGMGARVRAFRWLPNAQIGPLVAAAMTKPDGSFRLRVPAEIRLLVVADDANHTFRVEHGQTGSLLLELEEHDSDVSHDDYRWSTRSMSINIQLLPASMHVSCEHAESRELPDMQLREAVGLAGTVTNARGRPVAESFVSACPVAQAAAGSYRALHWLPGIGAVRGGVARTDGDGRFWMSLAPAVSFVMRTSDSEQVLPAGAPRTMAMAPGYVELVAR